MIAAALTQAVWLPLVCVEPGCPGFNFIPGNGAEAAARGWLMSLPDGTIRIESETPATYGDKIVAGTRIIAIFHPVARVAAGGAGGPAYNGTTPKPAREERGCAVTSFPSGYITRIPTLPASSITPTT